MDAPKYRAMRTPSIYLDFGVMVKAWPAHLTFSSSNRKSGSQATCTSSTVSAVAHGIPPFLPPEMYGFRLPRLLWRVCVGMDSRWVSRLVGGVERTDDADPVREGDRV